jgi:hypothetical protein
MKNLTKEEIENCKKNLEALDEFLRKIETALAEEKKAIRDHKKEKK